MTTFNVKVEPGQDAFTIDTSGTHPRITLTQSAEQGRANAELIRRLSQILGAAVHIVSGHRKRRKTVRSDLPEKEIQERLMSYTRG